MSKPGKYKCPWDGCSKESDTEHGLSIHYGKKHGESLSLTSVDCDWCGKTKNVYPSEKNKYDNHFCNRDCHKKWTSENNTGSDAVGWRGGKLKTECDYCETQIKKSKSEFENNKHHFCDRECYGKWRTETEGVEIDCTYCNTNIKRNPSDIKKYDNHFCGNRCYRKWQKESDFFAAENNPNWKGGKIKTECDWCDKDIHVTRWEFDTQKRHYCDTECMGKWRSENQVGKDHHQFDRVQVNCSWCDTKLLRKPYYSKRNENHFCDTECLSNWMSSNLVKDRHPSWCRIEKNCEWCGEKLSLRKSEIKPEQDNYFCGLECMGKHKTEYYSGSNHPLWEGGGSRISETIRRLIGPNSWWTLRKKMINKSDEKCEKCGSNYRPSVHHIVPLVYGGTHEEELLMVLCPTCHAAAESHIKGVLEEFVDSIPEIAEL